MDKLNKVYILFIFICYSSVINAQTYNMPGGSISTCSGNFYDTGGSGGNYGNNQDITTTFCSSSGNCITVTFSAFNTQSNRDYLYIYDGPTTGSTLLGTYTGTTSPGTVMSSTGCLTFRFTSNGSTVKAGWTAAISCSGCLPPSYNMPGGTISTCSASFYDPGGSGSNYANNQNITTTFCSSSGNCVSVAFSSFNLENGYDFLYVYDGPTTASTLIGTYTGTTSPGTVYATTGCLTFLFTSDGTTVKAGWAATISCITCGTGPPPSPQDCGAGAATVCSDQSFAGNSSGSGSVNDLSGSNEGCLTGGEHQSSWYYFSPSTSGNIQLSITPSNSADDYDFAIWGPMGAVTCPPNANPLRCSWAAGGGATGLQTGAGDNSEGATGDKWVESINATAGQVFILVIDNYTTSSQPFTLDWTLTGGASLDCNPLPIELLSFDAKCAAAGVNVTWAVASQLNNDYYSIERSTNAVNFENIGTVDGAGTTTAFMNYSFVDNHVPANQLLYYRLKQMDFNGHFTYSELVSVNCAPATAISVYPNPAQGLFTIEGAKENSDVTIYDVYGQTILKTKAYSTKTKIDLSNARKGVYFLKINTNAKRIVQKIIIN